MLLTAAAGKRQEEGKNEQSRLASRVCVCLFCLAAQVTTAHLWPPDEPTLSLSLSPLSVIHSLNLNLAAVSLASGARAHSHKPMTD